MLAFVGSDRETYPTDDYPHRIGGPIKEPYRETAGFHALDIGTNYFGIWTEADNIRRYYEKYSESLRAMQQRLGYRVRPSLVWQRKRYGTMELIIGIANHGVAGLPGVLGVYAESLDGTIKVGGNLERASLAPARSVRRPSFFPRAWTDSRSFFAQNWKSKVSGVPCVGHAVSSQIPTVLLQFA
jgi:hypothetical protein